MRLVGYARASTEDQQITLQDQREKLEAYARLYEHKLIEVVVGSESAKSLKRDKFQRALQLLRDGKAEGLLVLNVDRLCRDVADGQQLLREYFGENAKHGKHLFSVQDYIDTRTASGRMLFNLKLVMAQYERDQTSERTKAALAFKRKNGERCGSVPFGSDLSTDGTTLIKNKQEQKALSLIFKLRDEGWSQHRICQELDRRGISTKKGTGNWRVGSLQRILNRRC